MLSAVQDQLLGLFRKLTLTFAPGTDGGFLNLAFAPIKDTSTGDTYLQLVTESPKKNDLMKQVMQLVVKGTKDYAIYDLIRSSNDTQTADLKPAHYLFAAISAAVIALIAFLMVIGMMITVYCYFTNVSEAEGEGGFSGYKKVCYLTMGAFVLVFLILTLCTCGLAFASMDALAKDLKMGSKPTNTTEPPPKDLSVYQSLTYMLRAMESFLKDVIGSGKAETGKTVKALNSTMMNELRNAVDGLVDEVMKLFDISDLLEKADTASESILIIKNSTDRIVSDSDATVNAVKDFEQKMNASLKRLADEIQRVCTQLHQSKECQDLEKQVRSIRIGGITDKIDLAQIREISNVVNTFSGELEKVKKQMADLQNELLSKTQFIKDEIGNSIDLGAYLKDIDSIWDNVEKDHLQPLISSIQEQEKTFEKYITPASKIAPPVGFACIGIVLLIWVLALIYFILCVIEAFRQDLICGEGGKHDPGCLSPSRSVKCVSIVFVTLSFVIPLAILVASILIPVIGVVNVEVCRYLVGDGMPLTDRALDLYMKYQWPKLLKEMVDPNFLTKIQQTPPSGLLSGITHGCNPALPGPPGLLPKVGISNFVSAEGILTDPGLNDAINKGRQKVLENIKNANLAEHLPKDQQIKDIEKQIQDVTNQLDKVNFDNIIAQLRQEFVNTKELEKLLDQLDSFAHQIQSIAHNTIPEKTKEIRDNLKDLPGIQKKASDLADSLLELEKQKNLVNVLTQFVGHIKTAIQKVNNTNEVQNIADRSFTVTIEQFKVNASKSLNKNFEDLTGGIFPCGNLYRLFDVGLTVVCQNTSVLNRLGSNNLTYVAMWFILILTLLLLVIYFAQHTAAVAS